MRSVRAIEHSDVCILMVDATTGFESQDQRIFHIADRNKKGVVILVNKWDLKDKSTETANKVEEEIKKKIAPFSDVPILFISVLEKQRLLKNVKSIVHSKSAFAALKEDGTVVVWGDEAHHHPLGDGGDSG